MIVIADEWSGVECRESTVKDPARSDNNLTIGGGSGQYVLSACVDADKFFNLVRSVAADERPLN